jgi:hypothetical protein
MEYYPLEYTSFLQPIIAVQGLSSQGQKRQIDEQIATQIFNTLSSINSTTIWDSKKSFQIKSFDKVLFID